MPYDPTNIDINLEDLIDEEPKAPTGVVPMKVFGFAVPDGAKRIQVMDELGNVKWRRIEEVLPTDSANLDSSGKPYFMIGDVGRPVKQELHDVLAPPNPKMADLIKVKIAQMRTDPLVQAVNNSAESPDILDLATKAMAEEIASLRFERMEAERNGRDTSPMSVRRIAAIKALVDSWFKRRDQVHTAGLDLDSQEFQIVLQAIGVAFSLALQEAGVGEEAARGIFDLFVKTIEDPSWKSDLRKQMKEASK